MYPFRPDPIVRIRVPEPEGKLRRLKPCQPHTPSVVESARQLVEGTCLTQKVIAQRVGVAQGTVSRWCQRYDWQRPEGAFPLHRRPERRWVQPMVGWVLVRRLRYQAERLLREVESAPAVDPHKLAEALTLTERARAMMRQRKASDRRLVPPTDTLDDLLHPSGRCGRRRDGTAASIKAWRTRWARAAAAKGERGGSET